MLYVLFSLYKGFDLQFILNSLTELAIPDENEVEEIEIKTNRKKCCCTGT
jgi:hypothetical protein